MEIRKELELIHQRKKEQITRLQKINSAVLVYSYYSIVHNVSVTEMNKYFRSTLNVKVNPADVAYYNAIERYSISLVKDIRRRVKPEMKQIDVAVLALSVMSTKDSFSKLSGLTYQYARKIESNDKSKVISEALGNEVDITITDDDDKLKGMSDSETELYLAKIDSGVKIFYLASTHDDCAEDHINWQGKLYYDKDWHSKIKSRMMKEQIGAFIRNKGLKSFQWVVGKPVWLITRPNCRHFFVQIPVGKALELSESDLTKIYKTHSKIGRRKDIQTQNHPTDSGWYTKENVEGIIKKYKDRLAYHQSLASVKQTPTLKRAIEKDKLLIKKWTEYLNSHF